MSDSGTVKLAITVAQKLRRKIKMTRITSTIVKPSVRCTSVKLALIDNERSLTMLNSIDGGMPACNCGSIALTCCTSCSVFDPGCRQIPIISPMWLLIQSSCSGTSDPSTTRPISLTRTGAPLAVRDDHLAERARLHELAVGD